MALQGILNLQTTDKWTDRTRQWEIIVVDDGSRVPYPTATVRHSTSQGYGAALKTGIGLARGEYVVTCDGDGQHRWRDIERLVEFVEEFPELDMAIGDRRVKEVTWERHWGRKALNWTATLFSRRWIADLNSGMRVVRRSVVESYRPILCDGFSFTTSLTMACLTDGRAVDWLPIRVQPRRAGMSKVRLWADGWSTLRQIVWIGGALRTRRLRARIRPWVSRLRAPLPPPWGPHERG